MNCWMHGMMKEKRRLLGRGESGLAATGCAQPEDVMHRGEAGRPTNEKQVTCTVPCHHNTAGGPLIQREAISVPRRRTGSQ